MGTHGGEVHHLGLQRLHAGSAACHSPTQAVFRGTLTASVGHFRGSHLDVHDIGDASLVEVRITGALWVCKCQKRHLVLAKNSSQVLKITRTNDYITKKAFNLTQCTKKFTVSLF